MAAPHNTLPPVLAISSARLELRCSNHCQPFRDTVATTMAVMKMTENDAPMPR